MDDRDFWMLAYCAALSGGASSKGALEKARQAVEDLKARDATSIPISDHHSV